MKKIRLFATVMLALLLSSLFVTSLKAQFVRTSYFMEGVPARLSLNPALCPTNGYFNIPVIGAFNAMATSNALGTRDITDLIGNSSNFYNKETFRNNLKDMNRVNASVNADILSFGWYKGKGFWSVGVGVRTDFNASIDRSLFDYLYQVDQSGFKWDGTKYDINNAKVNVNAYTEMAVGYARQLNSKWTVGMKAKLLLGVANGKLTINNVHVEGNLPDANATQAEIIANQSKYYAKIKADATFETSFKGLELGYGNHNDGTQYINDIKTKSFGIGGYGAAFDFGVTYRPMSDLTLSASVLDLGFLNWDKKNNQKAVSHMDKTYNVTNYQEFQQITEKGDVLNYEMLDLRTDEKEPSRHTSLASTFVLGAEYAILNKKISFGVLYTNRNAQPNNMSEVTISANFRPKGWFNVAGSYSMIQSAGKSFGLGIKLGPVFIGTDYMLLGDNTKCVNDQIGMSVPLGGRKRT